MKIMELASGLERLCAALRHSQNMFPLQIFERFQPLSGSFKWSRGFILFLLPLLLIFSTWNPSNEKTPQMNLNLNLVAQRGPKLSLVKRVPPSPTANLSRLSQRNLGLMCQKSTSKASVMVLQNKNQGFGFDQPTNVICSHSSSGTAKFVRRTIFNFVSSDCDSIS